MSLARRRTSKVTRLFQNITLLSADLQRAQGVRRDESPLGPPWLPLRERASREVVHEAEVPMVPFPLRIPQSRRAEMRLDHHEAWNAWQPREIAGDAKGRMIRRFLDDEVGGRHEPGALVLQLRRLGLRITAFLRPGRACAGT